jgi:hypothetical protein
VRRGKRAALGHQLGEHLQGRAQPSPQRQDVLDRRPHLLIGREHGLPPLVPVETDRLVRPQVAAGRLVAQPAVQARADQMQLGHRHRPLQAEQQAVG